MHKLMEYICEELETLERKAAKEGKLTMAEVQYMDTLLHAKKNLLKSEEMYEESEEGGSYARGRGRRRDSIGRYSREVGNRGGSTGGSYEDSYGRSTRGGSYERGYSREDARENLKMDLRELEQEAGDEETRRMIKRWMKQLEE